jgi:FHA domain
MAFPPHSLSPSELAALREAERHGVFLAYRDRSGDLRLMPLECVNRATIGRVEENELALGWDPEVSRTHAQLELVGGDWTLIDDGLSRRVSDLLCVRPRRLGSCVSRGFGLRSGS